MEEEVKGLIKVTSSVVASMAYARFVSSKTRPGMCRLLAFAPVLLLLPFLPLSFSSIHLRGIFGFYLAWLAPFKLLLLSFGLGPLSSSHPLLTFISIASLPVKVSPSRTKSPSKSPFFSSVSPAIKALLLSLLVSLYRYKHQIHPYLLLALYCFHMYLALELVLGSAAALARALLDLDFELQFDAPYRSTSLQDFWGRRWNLMVTGILRPSVYAPIRARWGTAAGVMATFLVSGLMHEVMFYYLTLVGPTGEVTCFFVLHGFCTVVEVWAKRKAAAAGWRLHPAVSGPLSLGFLAATGSWLFFPPILRSGADEQVLKECAAMMGFLEGGGRFLIGGLSLMWNRTPPAVWS